MTWVWIALRVEDNSEEGTETQSNDSVLDFALILVGLRHVCVRAFILDVVRPVGINHDPGLDDQVVRCFDGEDQY